MRGRACAGAAEEGSGRGAGSARRKGRAGRGGREEGAGRAPAQVQVDRPVVPARGR